MVPLQLNPDQMAACFSALRDSGWIGAVSESRRVFSDLVGMPATQAILRTSSMRSPRDRTMSGDAVFRDEAVYYCMSGVVRAPVMERDPEGNPVFSGAETERPFLEVGTLTDRRDAIDDCVSAFASAVETAVRAAIPELATQAFNWTEPAPLALRTASLIRDVGGDDSVHFEPAVLSDDEVAASDILAEPTVRRLLREVSQAGFARRRDMGRGRKTEEDLDATLAILKDAGLINTEWMLECKLHRIGLARVSNRKQLEDIQVDGFKCGLCDRPYKDEVVTEAYSISNLGRKLNQKNHWLTVWVTKRLADLGVPLSAVLWNVAESSEEIDIALDFLGQLWIFELKDRDFAAGDAHPFNYRQVRYHADRSIILTTDKVQKDAKRVFAELMKEAQRNTRNSPSPAPRGPVFIEGLASVEHILRGLLSASSMLHATRRVSRLSEVTGYDFDAILETRFPPVAQAEAAEADIART